ncbi:WD40 repeat domain-containing protein, partial [Nostoc sp.]|uniref:WD40 repeat domain-containing protein n=1 Tax=Nostoc sp. TaxID=1180 RepID=UPI002FF8A802
MGEVAEKLAAYRNDPARLRAYLGSLDSVKLINLQKYYKVLTDFDFIAAKINNFDFGVQSLIEDYDLINDSELLNNPEYNPEQVKTLKLIQGALGLSAVIIIKDKMQLTGQLWGRMQHFALPEIQAMLEVAKQQKASPWLRPLTSNLISPGGSLLLSLTGHSKRVNAVAFTPNGKQVISASWDKTLKLWNLETGECEHTFQGHSDRVTAVALTSDGKQVISTSWDNTLKLWNLETGKHDRTFHGHRDAVNAVIFTPDGKQAISASHDKTLKLWNLETGKDEHTFQGHSNWVKAVALTPDGKQVISASSDNTLKLWNLETGKHEHTFQGHRGGVNAVALTPDG